VGQSSIALSAFCQYINIYGCCDASMKFDEDTSNTKCLFTPFLPKNNYCTTLSAAFSRRDDDQDISPGAARNDRITSSVEGQTRLLRYSSTPDNICTMSVHCRNMLLSRIRLSNSRVKKLVVNGENFHRAMKFFTVYD
jgi:hypothetical protein